MAIGKHNLLLHVKGFFHDDYGFASKSVLSASQKVDKNVGVKQNSHRGYRYFSYFFPSTADLAVSTSSKEYFDVISLSAIHF